jgi:hypothetical protein
MLVDDSRADDGGTNLSYEDLISSKYVPTFLTAAAFLLRERDC